MTRFSTDQLTTFATVIEYGTFDAAADILRVSPSAISQRIKAMEQIAGKDLTGVVETLPVELHIRASSIRSSPAPNP